MIPVFMKLQVRGKSGKGVNLWLPVILVWILLLLLMILIFPLVLLVALITWNRGYGKMLLFFYPRFFNLLFSLSGLKLDIESRKEKIFMDFV